MRLVIERMIMDKEELLKFIKKQMKELTKPLNLEKLVQNGVLAKKGNQYYVLKNLPKHAKQRIKNFGRTKEGSWVAFYKDTKSIEKLCKKINKFKI